MSAQEVDVDGMCVLDEKYDEEQERQCRHDQPDMKAADPGREVPGRFRIHWPRGAHTTGCLSQRRQVDVARVTRRSHSGQIADRSRLAVDQNANVEAGIAARQYTHGRLNCAWASLWGARAGPAGAETSSVSRELATMRHLGSAKHEAARMHEGRM
jgi:hypothetical protein